MIHKRVEKYGNSKIAVRHKPYGEWIGYTWKEFGDAIENCAKALLAAGTEVSDFVGIFSANSAWWAIADQACFHIRAASVPVSLFFYRVGSLIGVAGRRICSSSVVLQSRAFSRTTSCTWVRSVRILRSST